MFESLLLNPKVKVRLEKFLQKPSHAVLLVGPAGSGKRTLADCLAAQLLGINLAKLESYPYLIRVAKAQDKRDIPIEVIRALIKSLTSKVPGRAAIRRVVIIEDAEVMNTAAQNALLKSLEEPPLDTVFILTASSRSSLLPTIVSRTVSIQVEPVSLDNAKNFFESSNDVESAWILAQGAAGLLNSLVTEVDNDLRQYITRAKTLITKNRYERLKELDSLNKAELDLTLEAMARVLKAVYRSAAAKNDTKRVKASLVATQMILAARQDLAASVLSRLVILKLVLNLPL